MIKRAMYISLCLLWLGDVKAASYELPNQGLSFYNAFEFDDKKHFEVKDYISTNEPLAHWQRGHRYPQPRVVTHCHPVTVLGPPIWTIWGWQRYPVVLTDCHSIITCDDPDYHGPVDSPDFVETHCDYRSRGGHNRLLNAVCDRETSRIRSLLRRNIYFLDQRSDATGETALILAAKLGYNRIVRLLVEEFGADGCVAHRNLTAADWAYEFGHDRIERFLDRSFTCYD